MSAKDFEDTVLFGEVKNDAENDEMENQIRSYKIGK